MGSARASAQKLPSLFFSLGSQTSPPWLQSTGGGAAWSGSRAAVRPAIFAYELVAYIAKEVLDETSYEYLQSPIGSYLRRQTPAQHSRSEASPAVSGAVAEQDSPPTLNYTVRSGVALRDLWSGLHKGLNEDRSGFSLDPKVGAGRAGIIFAFRW